MCLRASLFCLLAYHFTSWWFQPYPNNINQIGSFPQTGIFNKQNLSNHHISNTYIYIHYMYIICIQPFSYKYYETSSPPSFKLWSFPHPKNTRTSRCWSTRFTFRRLHGRGWGDGFFFWVFLESQMKKKPTSKKGKILLMVQKSQTTTVWMYKSLQMMG